MSRHYLRTSINFYDINKTYTLQIFTNVVQYYRVTRYTLFFLLLTHSIYLMAK